MKFRKLDYLGIHQGQGDNCKFVFCYNVQQYVLLRRMFLSIRFEVASGILVRERESYAL